MAVVVVAFMMKMKSKIKENDIIVTDFNSLCFNVCMESRFNIITSIVRKGKAEAEKTGGNPDIFVHLLDEIERMKIEWSNLQNST